MIELKYLADEATCIAERDLPKIRGKKYTMYDAIHDQLGNIGTVKAVPVFIESSKESYLADMDTGSLYRTNDLTCLTGQITLRK